MSTLKIATPYSEVNPDQLQKKAERQTRPDSKTAARSESRAGICTVSDWRPYQKGSMRGSFTAHLPSGMIVHDVALFEKEGRRFLGMPRQNYKDKEGLDCFKRIIEFRDRKTDDSFRDQILRALDAAGMR